jgi:hypothetical protein
MNKWVILLFSITDSHFSVDGTEKYTHNYLPAFYDYDFVNINLDILAKHINPKIRLIVTSDLSWFWWWEQKSLVSRSQQQFLNMCFYLGRLEVQTLSLNL